MVKFEGYEKRIDKINASLKDFGLESLEQAQEICLQHGINVDEIVKGTQTIAFENATWAYTLGCAIALKRNCKRATDAAKAIGEGLQAFCVPGS